MEGTTLAHLLLQTPEPLYEITEFDAVMQKRIDGTHNIVSKIVAAIEKEHNNNQQILSMLSGGIVTFEMKSIHTCIT